MYVCKYDEQTCFIETPARILLHALMIVHFVGVQKSVRYIG